ncbi:unnamed protein product [Dovyalis caffra]|uniref:Uncharacterized protein n=1 Tax=Dovyalis caffra TaxID=77055 RepID=A0AAV1SGF1_9ROSI|nr:unnamed protein product [Dovyalis caffra]
MAEVPSLISLAIEAVKREVVDGDDEDDLVSSLSRPFKEWDDYEAPDDCLKHGRKRGRHGNFDSAWKALFKLRWPELFYRTGTVDWLQIYWQTHLQNCLDEASELALLPSFDGCIGEMKISDGILKYIGCEEHANHPNYSKLSYHCQQFGHYASCLRLPNVLCVAETCVDGLCKLLIQNSETLTSLELNYCKLSSTFVSAICASLNIVNTHTHGIRSLCSLKLHDNHLDRNFAWKLFSILLDASSNLSILDLSDNNIAGWLCNFNGKWKGKIPSSLGIGKSLHSLRVLNIRGNDLQKDDVESLSYALVSMPNLEVLDISENPIEDDGIRLVESPFATCTFNVAGKNLKAAIELCRCLIPYFIEAPERCSPLAELYLESCELSCSGATELLDTLSNLKRPLNSLSLADNGLGSQVAGALQKILVTPIKTLNVGGIGLGSLGFKELEKGMIAELKLVDINISKNRGGLETARFLSKLLSLAPDIIAINATYNLMPSESLTAICSALKLAKGSLERLDLTGNTWDYQPNHASMVAEFQHNGSGRPILILPSSFAVDVPYDDDP